MRVLIATTAPQRFDAWRCYLERGGLGVVLARPAVPDLARASRAGAPDVALADLEEGTEPLATLLWALKQFHPGESIPVIAVAGPLRLESLAAEEAADLLSLAAPPEEVLFRLRRAVARRPPPTLELGELTLSAPEAQVRVRGRPIHLSVLQFRLLWQLASRPDRVFTRDELLQQVWGECHPNARRRVDSCMKRLRSQLGEYGRQYLRSTTGHGYCLAAPGDATGRPIRPAADDG
jgi:DNA-binding response OmpR family regulator